MAEGDGEGQTTGAHSAMPDVFISYASQDVAVANTIVQNLETHGVKCWIAPRDVTPGSHYADGIMSAISGAKALVLVLSGSALASKHVGKEVERASSKGRPIIAIHTDTAPLTPAFEYFLSESQWIDVGAGGLAAVAAKLVEAVRLHLDSTVANEPPPSLNPSVAPRAAMLPRWRWVIACGAILSLALAYFIVDRSWLSKPVAASKPAAAIAPASIPVPPTIPEKSVAVLPFVDMSAKKDQEYFADGLSEELIDHLAHTPDLKVIARTSSFQFKGRNDDMRTIGQRLGVANLVEGSVRTSGKTVRVTAQLIKVSDGSHLWSETYDREISDIFKVQDAIAAAVVTALQLTLAASTARDRPVNTEAYKAILRGRYFTRLATKEDSERAIAAFREAIRLDPEYAIAFVELAITYDDRGFESWMPIAKAYAEAHSAIDRSLKIDPKLAIAHRALGWIERDFKYDFVTTQVERQHADQLDPADPLVLS